MLSSADRYLPKTLRRSTARWMTLSTLLTLVERGVEASARLDAYVPPALGQPPTVGSDRWHERFDARLRLMEHRIGAELDRLTAERLTVDLTQRMERERLRVA